MPQPMGDYCDYGRGYRSPGLQPYAAAGDRKKQPEIVGGKVYGASQAHLPARGPPEPPESRARGGGSSGGGAGWGRLVGDPEMKRRRRVASYKAYAVEGRVKASVRRGIRWIKGKCSGLVHPW
uniref:Cytoplasmic dynein 1 light intermediate chain 2 n=1 Tax=Anthurium amnicola TaxID=1678845 RepID=A0A1D1YA81_9ARAE